MGGDNGGKRRKGHQGIFIKDTGTMPKGCRIKGRKWGWLLWGRVVGGKWKQLYLNNNFKNVKKKINLKKYFTSKFILVVTRIQSLVVVGLLACQPGATQCLETA